MLDKQTVLCTPAHCRHANSTRWLHYQQRYLQTKSRCHQSAVGVDNHSVPIASIPGSCWMCLKHIYCILYSSVPAK